MAVVRDSHVSETIRQRLAIIDRYAVRVGYFPGATHLSRKENTGEVVGEVPTAYIASIHEYGAPKANIPPRSFFRTSATEQRQKWADFMAKLLDSSVKGKIGFSKGLETIGLVVSKDIAHKIDEITEPALKERTLAARQARRKSPPSKKPLIDTALMRDQLTFEVSDAKTGEAKSIG